jgi:hypothetical protein
MACSPPSLALPPFQFFDAWGADLTDSETTTFYTLTETGETGLSEATDVVHKLFMAATDYALLHQVGVWGDE